MTFSSKFLSVVLAGASVVTITACSHPNAMPTGYTYHHDLYKSPAPPMPKGITSNQRQYMNEGQAEQFRDGTYSILEKLTMRAGMPPKPVYVLTPSPMSNFYANIDNDLRENMRHIGYALSDIPTEAYVFTYDARYIEPAKDVEIIEGAPNVELVLRVYNELSENARLLSTERGQFYIQGAETLKIQPTRYKILPVIVE